MLTKAKLIQIQKYTVKNSTIVKYSCDGKADFFQWK